MMWIWSRYCLYDEITAWRRRQCRLNLRKRKLPKKRTWRNAEFGMFLGTKQATTHNSQSHECAMNLNLPFLFRCLCFLRRRRPQKTQNDTIKSKTCLDWISFLLLLEVSLLFSHEPSSTFFPMNCGAGKLNLREITMPAMMSHFCDWSSCFPWKV